jgi:hypothetical protein
VGFHKQPIEKISTPLSYIIQAAMGQCSTLPAETKNAEMKEQTDRLNENGRKESLDFNVLIPVVDPTRPLHRKTYQNGGPSSNPAMETQVREPDGAVPMDVDTRDEPAVSLPLPPENAVRARCYKLNLESEISIHSTSSSTSAARQHSGYGPFSEAPPQLTYSSSEDSTEEVSDTAVAIQTAQIFRGITVSRDGTILSQNARATRSNRGNKTKVSEKSRQAAKIDKAKDLVEETADSVLVSLVVFGEYDDMKHLVRDGSRKLREAETLPDDALLSVNKPRIVGRSKSASAIPATRMSSTPTSMSSSRRRRSTNGSSPSSHNNATIVTVTSPKATSQTAPPKLKSNPRDTTRRKDGGGLRMRLDTCNDFMDRRGMGGVVGGGFNGGGGGDDDWSHAWNLWNCGGGGGGTISPLQPSSPNKNTTSNSVIEGRNDVACHAGGGMRDTGFSGRAS